MNSRFFSSSHAAAVLSRGVFALGLLGGTLVWGQTSVPDDNLASALWYRPDLPPLRIILLRASPQRLIYRLDQADSPETSLELPSSNRIEPLQPHSLRAALTEMRAGRLLEARAMFEQLLSLIHI